MENWPKFSLKKVKFEGMSDYYLLSRIKDNHEDIILELSNGTASFHGSISAKEMRVNQQNSRLGQADFVKLTLGALTNVQSSSDEHFYYSLQEDTSSPDQWVMTWKKSIPEENIKFQLGSVKLLAVHSGDTIATVLSCAAGQISELEKEIFALRKEKDTLQSEKKDLVVMFEEKIHQKTDLETQLLTKFLVVLNKKKAKIRDLKSEIQSVDRNNVHKNSDDEVSQEKTCGPGSKVMSQNSSLDSSLQFPDDATNVPKTSRHIRRVRQARNPNLSTPPLRKKRTVTKSKNSNKGSDSDLDLDTMELMDKI